jgi:hypothetical protein
VTEGLEMTNGRFSVGLLLGAVALTTPAAAQDARKFSIGAQATVEHDTNVARASDAQAALRGISPADTIFTPSVNLDYTAPIGRQSVFARGSAGYAFYDKNTDLNRERLDFTGGGIFGVGPCLTTLQGQYTRGLRHLEDSILEADVKNIQENKTLSANTACSRPTGFGVTFSGSKGWTENSLATVVDADYETISLGAGITYSRPAIGTITGFTSYNKTEYPNRILSSGYELTSYGLTFDRQLGARIQGSVTLAYTTVDQLDSAGFGGGSYSSNTYGGNLSYRASSRLLLQASFNRSITPSTGLGQSFDVATNYGLTGDYDLGSRIRLSLGAQQVEREAEGIIVVSPLQITSSKTKIFYGAVKYSQSERLSFTLKAAREERDANVPQFDYTSDSIGLSANVTF